MGVNSNFIIDLSEVYEIEEDLVGKKAYELGILQKLGIPIPGGFIITNDFFKEFLRLTGIDEEIQKARTLSHPAISDSAEKLFQPIRNRIMRQSIPQVLAGELHKFYRELSGTFKEIPLNIFSSSMNNNSTVFRNMKGDANLILKIKTIWSLNFKNSGAIVVQENINSGITNRIATVNPIIDSELTKTQMIELTNYCNLIQKHFYFPKEIEYAIIKNNIFITKINPFTGSVSLDNKLRKTLIKGISINPGIATGRLKILRDKRDNTKIKKGEIVVAPNLSSLTFDNTKNAKAVIIDAFLQKSLNRILFKNHFKIPAIEGAKNATKIFKNGNVVTVNGVSGEIYSGGLIY